MKLLWQTPDRRRQGRSQCVALFGSGLIGGQLLSCLSRQKGWQVSHYPYSWHDEAERRRQRAAILSACRHLADNQPSGDHQLNVVWAAGRSGFSSSVEMLEQEQTVFSEIHADFERFSEECYKGRARFHHISSAGGLFEGQRLVSCASVPAPGRPYGFVKLAQEQILLRPGRFMQPFIYRPSSVYGFNRPGDRIGLIAALLRGAARNREIKIYGRPSTLRDFVLADDVAGFMASKIANPESEAGIFLLASGKPTSVSEVIAHVRKLEDRNLMLRYIVGDSNVADNTFSQDGLPGNWFATPLEIGIAKVAGRIRSAFSEGQSLSR